MFKILVKTIFLGLISFSTFGQVIQIIEKNPEYEKVSNLEEFHLIDSKLDLSNSIKVAKLTGITTNNSQNTVVHLFQSFKWNANYLGANAYVINESKISETKDSLWVSVTFYYLNENEISLNTSLYPTNMVYVIGDVEVRKTSGKKIKFNKKPIELLPLEYVSYQNKVGEEAIVSIGGFLGSKVWIKGTKNRLPKHLSLQGFKIGLGTGSNYNPNNYGQIAVNFTTGQIYPVDLELGLFLTKILIEKPY